ncbi:hypothetical protein C5E43_29735 [Nocardia cyriacigeorgica]|nr:hypothetical protein C5B73_13455 [Nocardia cyriacigeorgica]PPI99569.1 hypothetical protein C5E43_29735 [Nocardia cyriacigeorgica]
MRNRLPRTQPPLDRLSPNQQPPSPLPANRLLPTNHSPPNPLPHNGRPLAERPADDSPPHSSISRPAPMGTLCWSSWRRGTG